MSPTLATAQHATAPLATAVEALLRGEPVDVVPLLPVVRAAGIRAYPGAAADTVDVKTLVDVLQRRPDLEGSADDAGGDDGADPGENRLFLAVDDDGTAVGLDPRGAPARQHAARSLVDACVLALEARKLAHGLVATPTALKASFATPDEARAVLGVVGSLASAAMVVLPSSSSSSSYDTHVSWLLERVPADRPLHVVVGGGARRLFDVLAPSVRRLRVELALVGRRGTVVDDEDVYRGLRRLHEDSPPTVTERRTNDASEGCWESDGGAVLFVDGTRLTEDLVDRRARSLVLPLKRARAGIVGVVDEGALAAVLQALGHAGRRVVSLQTLAPTVQADNGDDADSSDGSDGSPDGLVVDAATGHGWPVSSSSSLSVPWLGLLPVGVSGDEGAFAALQGAAWARLERRAMPLCRLRRMIDDDSTAALAALAAMVAV
jgi:hypothetical protein